MVKKESAFLWFVGITQKERKGSMKDKLNLINLFEYSLSSS